MEGEHSGHRERMRDRFAQNGLKGFAAHEVLELMLFFAIPRGDVNPLAHRLMNRFGSFHAVVEADVRDLMKVEGIGMRAATLLSLFGHVERYLRQSRSAQLKKLENRRAGVRHCQALLSGLRQEHMYLVCLNAQMEVVQDVLIAQGTLNEVPSYPRLVAEAALRANAHAVILCHNHPGGTAFPSQQDMETTQTLGVMLHGLEVVLIDHVIVAGNDALSMWEEHLLEYEGPGVQQTARAAEKGGDLLMRRRVQKGKA